MNRRLHTPIIACTASALALSAGLLFAGTGLIVMALLARGFVPAPGPTRPVRGDSERLTSA